MKPQSTLRQIANSCNLTLSDLTDEFKAWALAKLKDRREFNAPLAVTNALFFNNNGKFYDSKHDRWFPICKPAEVCA